MKKQLFLILVLMAFTTGAFAQKEWVGVASGEPGLPVVQLVEQNTGQLILDVEIPGFWVTNYIENGKVFQKLQMTAYSTTEEVGKPELPMIHKLIGIPSGMKARISILEYSSTVLENYLVYPFQTPTKDIPGAQSDKFVIDEGFYKQDRQFPAQIVDLGQPGIWRDVRVAGLHIAPLRVNPATGKLEAVKKIRIRVEFYGHDSGLVLKRDKQVSPVFYKMYDTQILNFGSLGYTKEYKANDDIKYLIITNTSCLTTIEPLVEWKNQQGFRVEVRTMESGFTTPQNFKDYVAQLYADDDLEYVLMVGDAYPNGGNGGGPDDVPMYYWAPSGEDPSYSDSWYTCMDGPDDHYADLAIGRFTYDNQAELALQIQKTMDHYLNPDAATNWAENSILIAHKEEYPGKYTQCCEEIRTYPYSLQVPIFEPAYGGAGYSNQQVVDYLNANSCGILNYRGHGSTTEFWEWCNYGSFTATHVAQLTNTDRLFVVFDVCCDNMDIVAYSGNCLCESFMESPVAAVAINGAIIPSYTIPNHDYDKEQYKAIFDEGIYNIGYITNYANVVVLNNHGSLGRSNVRTYLWLGDASLEPWTLQPANITATHDPQLFLGLSTFDILVTDNNGPLENAMVCVTNSDQSVYGVAFTDASGSATVTFDSPVQTPGTAKVTVSVHNHLPYQADIQVIPQSGPYVIKDSYTLNDQTGGNGDGLMDYGESILLTLAMKNVGVAAATNVTVSISTADPYITITDNTASYGTIGPNQVVSIPNGFAFDVADNLPDEHIVIIQVEASGTGEPVWNSNLTIPGHAPVLEMNNNVTVSDPTGNGNGKIDPGETVNLLITAENNGSSGAVNVAGLLTCTDPYITINQGQANYGNLAAGGAGQQTFSITAAANTPAGHIANFTFNLTANLGITGTGTFFKVVGQIPVLILDLDGNHSSGPAMKTAVENLGVGVEYVTAFPADLSLYSSIFVCLGIYSSNHVLSTDEGQKLANFLNGGGNLYMEGGDTWYYDSQTPVHSMFHISGVSDGSSDLGTIAGYAGTFTANMSFQYNGENNWIDHLAPVAPAFNILKNVSPAYETGVAYDAGSYKTIGCSHEFGGLTDGSAPSTKEELMKQYLIHMGIMIEGVAANFTANIVNVCEGGTVQFTDLSLGSPTSWSWTFEGGTPATSNLQNPAVVYSTAGTFDVTLTVSDGTYSNTLVKNDFITGHTPPTVTLQPFPTACINWPPFQLTGGSPAGGTYSGQGVTNNMFDPAAAGLGTHVITYTYTDQYGCSNDAQANLVVDPCTGIDEIASESVVVYPNPNQGNLTVTLNLQSTADVRIVNALGEVVFEQKQAPASGGLEVNTSGLTKGVYYLQIVTPGGVMTKKIVRN